MSVKDPQALAALYRAQEVRELDRLAIEVHGIPAAELMRRAGQAAWQYLRQRWPRAQNLLVICGTGNNGGDGFVVAAAAARAKLSVTVHLLGKIDDLSEEARVHADDAQAVGVQLESGPGIDTTAVDVIVDAMLGTGLSRPVDGEFAPCIRLVNQSGVPVLALDIPSGLQADTGAILGSAVSADATVTFIGRKQGLYTGSAAACCGDIEFADLDVPTDIFNSVSASSTLLNRRILQGLLRPRSPLSHKGSFGHVLVIGGNHGYSGAARMAGEAAARVGSGLVSIATRPEHASVLNLGRPELMVRGVRNSSELAPLVAASSVIAIGPGLGRDDWSREMLTAVLDARGGIVVDADALNIVAASPGERDNWILTPHPGEAARLLDTDIENINADRFSAARAIQQRFGGVCVLKGAGTVIVGEDVYVNPYGNAGMASGGMGDVLTGVIAGLLAQGFEHSVAAALGVVLHALAGDEAARDGQRGMLATDLIPIIRRLVNP